MLQLLRCQHTCFQCQHFDHKVVDCPFPMGALLEKDLATKKAAQGQQGLGKSAQTPTAASHHQGLQPPAALHLPPGQGNQYQVPVKLLQFPQL